MTKPVLAKPVEGRHFAGQGANRVHLDIAVMGDLRHLLVILPERFPFLANLVEALCFEQHTGIGAGQTDNRKGPDQSRSDETIGIVQGKGDLPHSSVFIPRDKKYVITLA
jgi:hypothetical protein